MATAQKKRPANRSRTAQSRGGARGRAKTAAKRTSTASRARRPVTASRTDAISLLKADHRRVEELFERFEKARTEDRKQSLATEICTALRVHSQIEEEIFYPAFFETTQEEDLHHEAVIEHDGAKKLIAEIESSGPGDEYFDARVTVLSEMIKHHVREEEQRDGMFSKARESGMDLAELGKQLAARKSQLENEPGLLKGAKQLKDAGKGLISRVLGDV
jgi:hemerythrin superfamily protein